MNKSKPKKAPQAKQSSIRVEATDLKCKVALIEVEGDVSQVIGAAAELFAAALKSFAPQEPRKP